jgi:hypothetical protein
MAAEQKEVPPLREVDRIVTSMIISMAEADEKARKFGFRLSNDELRELATAAHIEARYRGIPIYLPGETRLEKPPAEAPKAGAPAAAQGAPAQSPPTGGAPLKGEDERWDYFNKSEISEGQKKRYLWLSDTIAKKKTKRIVDEFVAKEYQDKFHEPLPEHIHELGRGPISYLMDRLEATFPDAVPPPKQKG